MAESFTKAAFSQQLLDLKQRFSRIANNDSKHSREEIAACACGGKLLVRASNACMFPLDLPTPQPIEHPSDDDSFAWSGLWNASVSALSLQMPELFPSNSHAVAWKQVESADVGKLMVGQTKKEDWRIRIENFAFVCQALSDLVPNIEIPDVPKTRWHQLNVVLDHWMGDIDDMGQRQKIFDDYNTNYAGKTTPWDKDMKHPELRNRKQLGGIIRNRRKKPPTEGR